MLCKFATHILTLENFFSATQISQAIETTEAMVQCNLFGLPELWDVDDEPELWYECPTPPSLTLDKDLEYIPSPDSEDEWSEAAIQSDCRGSEDNGVSHAECV